MVENKEELELLLSALPSALESREQSFNAVNAAVRNHLKKASERIRSACNSGEFYVYVELTGSLEVIKAVKDALVNAGYILSGPAATPSSYKISWDVEKVTH